MPTVREVLLRMDEAVPGASDDDVRKAFIQEYGVDINGVGEEQLDIEIESLPQDPLPSAPLPPIGPPPDDDKSALWRSGLFNLSKVARGAALESPLALARAIGFEEAQVPHGMTFEEAVESPDVEISPSVALNERWKQWEQEVYEPSTSIDDVLTWPPSPKNLINFIGEGMVGSIPGMAYAIYSMPSFAWSLVGDIATTRAANEGRAVTPQDLLVAVGTATGVAGLERAGAKAAGLVKGQPGILKKAVATRGTRLGRTGAAGAAEAGTEAIQEYVQAAGEQAFTETGMDQTEAAKRMLGGALIGGPTGAMFRGGREVQLAAAERAGILPEAIYEDELAAKAEEATVAPVEEVVGAVIEEPPGKPGTVPGEYTDIASSLEVEAVDVQLETKSAIEAIEGLEETIKASEPQTPPPAPRATDRPVEAKPRKKYKPPNFMKEAIELLRKHADPETVEEDLLKAAMHVIGRKRRKDADIDDEGFAAQKAYLDPYIKQVGERMGMTEEEVDALSQYESMSYADTIRSVEDAGLAPSLGPAGVTIPAELSALIRKTNATGYAPSTTEEAAMHWALMLQRKARADILENADPEDGESKTALDKLDQDALETAMALRRSGTELGRAMRYRQFLVSPVMDLIQAQAEAAILSGGKLDAKTKARLEKLWKNAEAIEAEGKRLKKEAMAKLKVAKKRLADAEAIAAGTMDVKRSAKAEARKRAAKDVAAEAESVVEAPVETAATVDLDAPIRVTPLRKSKEQRRMEKELREAQEEVGEARGEALEGDALIRKAEREKSEAAKEVSKGPFLRAYDKAFGGAIALKASGDLSAFGRQALPLVIANPLLAVNILPDIIKVASWKPKARAHARAIQAGLLDQDFQALRDIGGVELTEVQGLTNVNGSSIELKEEAYMFRAFESGLLASTVGKGLINPSQDAFGLTLNLLRAKNFDALARQMAEAHGIDLSGMSDKEAAAAIMEGVPREDLAAAGRLINVITGRGEWASGKGVVSETLRRLMFAPRFTLSRVESPKRILELYTGTGKFRGMSKEARGVLVKRVNVNMGVYASLMLLTFVAAGDEDDDWMQNAINFFDPNNSSFLKARVGDWHFDMLSGVPATIRHMIPTVFVGMESGTEYGLGWWRLFNNKVAPLISGLRTLSGHDWGGRTIKDSQGNSITMFDGAAAAATLGAYAAIDVAIPISVENAAKAFLEHATEEDKTVVQRAVPVFAEFWGAGVDHYDPEKKKSKKGRGRRRPARASTRRRSLYR